MEKESLKIENNRGKELARKIQQQLHIKKGGARNSDQ